MAKNFEELLVWKEARLITVSIYKVLKENRDYGFRDQIQRASVSIMNNIAEGSESGTNTMFVRYLFIAKASCGEVRSMLLLAEDLDYIKKEEVGKMIDQTNYISKGIGKLIQYLKECESK